jgi:hypothetical protein
MYDSKMPFLQEEFSATTPDCVIGSQETFESPTQVNLKMNNCFVYPSNDTFKNYVLPYLNSQTLSKIIFQYFFLKIVFYYTFLLNYSSKSLL